MPRRVPSFYEDESGATAMEYVLIAALIALVIIASTRLLGTNLSTKFASIATQVSAAGR